MDRYLTLPEAAGEMVDIKKGDYCYISGVIYTARDAAHGRMIETIAEALGVTPKEFMSEEFEFTKERKEKARAALPFDIREQTIYYLGPTPAREGQVIGSAGPTTSTRMDKYTPRLLDLGLKGMIGKGRRGEAVIDAMKRNDAVYFAAVGGAGALLSKCIKEAEVIAYDDLGTEAIRRLRVENLPVIVVIDHEGHDAYSHQSEH